MCGVHMSLPEFPALPVFIEHEVSWVVIVLVQIILDAPILGLRDLDELLQLRFDQLNLVCLGVNVRNDRKFRHRQLLVVAKQTGYLDRK